MNMYLKYGKRFFTIYETEYYKPLELRKLIEDFLYDCIGEKTYQVDIGNNRDPEYITKRRTLKSKHWSKLEWGVSPDNIIFIFNNTTLEHFTVKDNCKIYPKIWL